MRPNTVKNGYTNPAALLTYGSGVQSEITRILTSVFAEVRPVEGLTLRTQSASTTRVWKIRSSTPP